MLRVFGLWLFMTVAALGTVVAQTGNVDPVGTYEFSTYTNNRTINGTLTITRSEEGALAALMDAPDAELPPLQATSVEVEGKEITLVIPMGQEGDIRMTLILEGEDITGRWFVGMDSGEITGKRVKKS